MDGPRNSDSINKMIIVKSTDGLRNWPSLKWTFSRNWSWNMDFRTPVRLIVPDLTHISWVRVKLRPVIKGHERSILYYFNDIIQMTKHSPRSLLKISKNLKKIEWSNGQWWPCFSDLWHLHWSENAFRQIMWWVMWPSGPAWPHVIVVVIMTKDNHVTITWNFIKISLVALLHINGIRGGHSSQNNSNSRFLKL